MTEMLSIITMIDVNNHYVQILYTQTNPHTQTNPQLAPRK